MTHPSHDPDRLEREREFHNTAFTEETRSGAWKFYDVAHAGYDAYARSVAEYAGMGDVLEYGCGRTGQAVALARAGAQVTGIDISDAAVALSTEAAVAAGVSERTSFVRMDAEHLSYAADSFDVVCGSSIIHHLDLPRAYAEVARVLRPQGHAVFLEPLGYNPLINAYRNRTPELRTPDEHPLRRDDIMQARAYFDAITVHHFTLSTLGTVPLRRSPRFSCAALRATTALDRLLLHQRSPLRWWSWTAVIVLSQPRSQ